MPFLPCYPLRFIFVLSCRNMSAQYIYKPLSFWGRYHDDKKEFSSDSHSVNVCILRIAMMSIAIFTNAMTVLDESKCALNTFSVISTTVASNVNLNNVCFVAHPLSVPSRPVGHFPLFPTQQHNAALGMVVFKSEGPTGKSAVPSLLYWSTHVLSTHSLSTPP